MVVDDSRAVRMIIGRILRELGYDVTETGDGRQALDALAQNAAVDVVLADWNMPEMDGISLLKAIRANDALRGIPVIMVTTEAEFDQMSTAMAEGATEYVMKPFTKEILVDKLRMTGLII
jgi:two-component system chemotaxis response regulator CheY